MRQVVLWLSAGLGIGLGLGVVLLLRPSPTLSPPDERAGRVADPEAAPGLRLRAARPDAPPPPATPASVPLPEPPVPAAASPQPEASRSPWAIPYEGPDLGFEAAAALVRTDVTERDLTDLLERQYLPGLADVQPPLGERQREEILAHLRSTARDYLLAERVECGLRGHLQEEARVRATRIQSQANRATMRYIRERVLSREQDARLPPYWKD